MVVCYWRCLTTMVLQRHDWVFAVSGLLLCSGCVPCSSSAHRAPGKKAAVPIYKFLVSPGRETNSRPTSTEADALTTRPRAGLEMRNDTHQDTAVVKTTRMRTTQVRTRGIKGSVIVAYNYHTYWLNLCHHRTIRNKNTEKVLCSNMFWASLNLFSIL